MKPMKREKTGSLIWGPGPLKSLAEALFPAELASGSYVTSPPTAREPSEQKPEAAASAAAAVSDRSLSPPRSKLGETTIRLFSLSVCPPARLSVRPFVRLSVKYYRP